MMNYNTDLKQIRSAFPDWPSELDLAKVPSNWIAFASAFYCAAKVLNEESSAAFQEWTQQEGQPVRAANMIRTQTQIPAEFCLAFSMELAIKAVLVSQGKLDDLSSEAALPFGNHMLHTLARDIDGFEVTSEEEGILLWASRTVLSGKYPVSKKPSDSKDGVKLNRSFSELYDKVYPLYQRLMDLVKESKENA